MKRRLTPLPQQRDASAFFKPPPRSHTTPRRRRVKYGEATRCLAVVSGDASEGEEVGEGFTAGCHGLSFRPLSSLPRDADGSIPRVSGWRRRRSCSSPPPRRGCGQVPRPNIRRPFLLRTDHRDGIVALQRKPC